MKKDPESRDAEIAVGLQGAKTKIPETIIRRCK